MRHRISDIKYCEGLFDAFYDIGVTWDGGVTRLGYSAAEDEMHLRFSELAEELGCEVSQDEAGNTFAANTAGMGEYYLIGSHLDSVVEGGRYDGVAGVMAALMVLRWLREDGADVPLKAAAFRCEESSNFGLCTIGSGLITAEEYAQDIGGLTSQDGRRLDEIFRERRLSLRPKRISGVKEYLELHIEQGKVLEETRTEIGVVNTIAGPRRFRIILRGMAEHSGATPMAMRNDALCAASEVILAVERIGKQEAAHQSVATVGVVNNHPNVMNVIPGEVELGVDVRGINVESLDRIVQDIRAASRDIAAQRGVEMLEVKISETPPVAMSVPVQRGLERAVQRLQLSFRNMPSGAGHDAMAFAPLCDTGMVFIPCRQGVSHNRKEFTSITSICDGARVLYEYLGEKWKGGAVCS